MAAPLEKTTRNLSGKWKVNKELSDSIQPLLSLQGIGYLMRKAISVATVQIELSQFAAPPSPPSKETNEVVHIDVTQTASGLSGSFEKRCLDNVVRDHSDWLFGNLKIQTRWVSLDEIEDKFLASDWLIEGDGRTLIMSSAQNEANGWQATQVWGFQTVDGERRYCHRVLVTKGGKKETARLVHEYLGDDRI